VAAFALFGLFTSVTPGFIAGTRGDRSHALAGLATFVVFDAAALARIALSRAAASRQLRTGLTALTPDLALVTIAVWLPSLTLFLLGGTLAGAGASAAFRGGVSTVIAIAPVARRGGTLAGLFLAAYFGIAVPVLGLGVASPARQRPGRGARLRRGPGGCRGGRQPHAGGRAGRGGPPPGRRNPRQPGASPGDRPAGNSGGRYDAIYTRLTVQFYQGRNLP
jgi:hypothetical protein